MKPFTMAGAVLAAIVSVTLVGCSGAASTPDPDARPIVATATRDDVLVTLTLLGPPRSGGLSWATVRIENRGPKAIRWARGGCTDPASISIDLGPAFAAGRSWPGLLGRFKSAALVFENPAARFYIEESKVGRNALCPASLSLEDLAPGATIGIRAAWDGSLAGAPAPPASAIVTATFPFIGVAGTVGNDVTDTKPIEARLDTAVGGPVGRTASALSPALAVDAALADPEFAAFVVAAPEASWVNPHLVRQDGTWGVGLFRDGPGASGEPRTVFGEVRIDGAGQVVGRRFEP